MESLSSYAREVIEEMRRGAEAICVDDEDIAVVSEELRINTTLMYVAGRFVSDTGAAQLAEVLKVNSTISELDLSSCYFGDVGVAQLAEALKVNSTVTALELFDNGIDDAGAAHLAETLKVNSTLTVLDLYKAEIGDLGAVALAAALQVNTSLTFLNIAINDFGDIGSSALMNALRGNSALAHFDAGGLYINHESALHLEEMLRVNATLTYLALNEAHEIEDRALHGARETEDRANALAGALAAGLRVNTTLKTLDLSHRGLRFENCALIAEALKVNTSLSTLDLTDNRCAGGNLAEALKVNTSLSDLTLCEASISNWGAGQLAEALEVNHVLTSLGLRSNFIDAHGARYFANALRVNKSLKSLDLTDNPIGPTECDPEFSSAIQENPWARVCFTPPQRFAFLTGHYVEHSAVKKLPLDIIRRILTCYHIAQGRRAWRSGYMNTKNV
jgi:Ran GTPase-activating protein (RanGAP) involved in mRNA processing and transport